MPRIRQSHNFNKYNNKQQRYKNYNTLDFGQFSPNDHNSQSAQRMSNGLNHSTGH